jgi:uncharacterized membrane protein YphA (DoxX/SURF4 family)
MLHYMYRKQNMLNIFPIQFLAPIAFLILRVCVGLILIRLGVRHFRNRHTLMRDHFFAFPFFPFPKFSILLLCIFEWVVGVLFIIGLFTQIAALLTLAYSLKAIFLRKYFTHPLMPQRLFFILLGAVSLTLFITGAGHFAFDLPI